MKAAGRELGVHLIDRTTRSVTLTPAGVAYLRDARRILQLAEVATQTDHNCAEIAHRGWRVRR